MKISILAAGAALALIAHGAAVSQAASTEPVLSLSKGSGQAYPAKPVRIVIPITAGSISFH